MHVAQVRTNWKQSDPEGMTFDLGQRVNLTGPNGSGKSAPVEAIELCLTGKLSRFAGRTDVKDSKQFWRSKPHKAKILFIEVTLSNDTVVGWEQTRSNQKNPNRTLNGGPFTEGALPVVTQTVAEIRDHLFGSPAKAEKWLTKRFQFSKERVIEDAIKAINKAMAGDGSEVPAHATEAVAAIEAIAETKKTAPEVLEALASLQREANSEAKAAESVQEELEYDVEIVTDEQLTAATEAWQQAQSALDTTRNVARLGNDLRGLAGQMLQSSQQLQGMQQADPAATQGLAAARAILGAIEVVKRAYPNAGMCPCCRQGVAPGHLDERENSLRGYIAQAARVQGVLDTRAAVEQGIQGLRQRAQTIKGQLDPAVFAQVVSGAWTDPTLAAENHVVQTRAALDDLQAKRVGAAGPQMAASKAQAAATRAVALKVATKALTKAQSTIVEGAASRYAEACTAYFPDHFGTPTIKLRPKVVLGVDRGGAVGVPSDGEEAVLLLSMAAALTAAESAVLSLEQESRGPDDTSVATSEPLRLLILDDRGYDADTLTQVMACLNDWDAGQLFIPATTRAVSNPAAWTTLVFGGADAAPTPPPKKTKGNGKAKGKKASPKKGAGGPPPLPPEPPSELMPASTVVPEPQVDAPVPVADLTGKTATEAEVEAAFDDLLADTPAAAG